MINILNRKVFLRLTLILLALGMSLMAGCVKNNGNVKDEEKKKTDVQADNQKKIMLDFDNLLKSDSEADTIIKFIDKNASNISKENLTIMINELEKIQKNNLTTFEEKYYRSEEVQRKINSIYNPDLDLSKVEDIQDNDLKNILIKTRDSGYKVETAEGMYFPIINYEYYKKYSSNVTDDLKDYIDIMAAESNKVPVKDAALIIGWDEIVSRTLDQERFLKNHENSVKSSEIEELKKRYLTFMLYGANNTPLFSYDSGMIDENAKNIYLDILKSNEESGTIQMLRNYMDILSKTGYKLSDEAEKYRKEIIGDNNF
ncbi:hypothetical protein Curi_c27600 [Gottschalkia acidurici 9a]|uniref:Lipoprotein n=1 Tax=Gottschalkia acidurici (strain ATCC 7906 / DSM 604 / BCRC 14475 / CIP 104303 / KCTC 5404 / NCIMB 10678 / 9a) TaxID=1128398 RepID=K0B160_GOTA9|nr:hypothetical protein [Gottschalkia acidurici]AFS79753.1 hypothetical protein Curi_c27600 [Gottschalkia acidurici 9a]